jgi:hypothetical protein
MLEVSGDAALVEEFVEKHRTDESDLDFKVSMPQGAWGTKWTPDHVEINLQPGYVHYDFDTAWSPPEHWLAHVAGAYPKLAFTLKYAEGGNDFCGQMEAVDGQASHVISGDIHSLSGDDLEWLEESFPWLLPQPEMTVQFFTIQTDKYDQFFAWIDSELEYSA